MWRKGWKLVLFLFFSRIFCMNSLKISSRVRLLSKFSSRLFSTTRNMNKSEDYIKTLLICGPSGVGKGTLISRLLNDYGNIFMLSVSHTSRAPRPGEIDGVHYHFISKEQFQDELKNGKFRFLESAEVHGNFYGTREDAVAKIHDAGKLCVLDVDTKGVMQFKQKQYPMRTIFVAPPSLEVLEQRLRGRGTESEERIQLRIHNARGEMEYGYAPGNFERIIINDDLDTAYTELVEQAKVWFPSYFSK